MQRGVCLIACALFLVGCQTANKADYIQIGYGPSFDVAHAQCELQSGSVDRGYFAFGSPAFVAGAGLGNAIGNAVARDQFMKNCLILKGWKRDPHGGADNSAAQTAALEQKPFTPASSVPGGWINSAMLEWSAADRQCAAGDKAACQTRTKLGAKLRSVGINP